MTRRKVVIDTNVLVSALLREGSVPGEAAAHAMSGNCEWLVDARILAEYRTVLNRPELKIPQARIERVLLSVERDSVLILASPLRLEIPDPSDLPILEVAVTGGADALVTGHIKHFQPRGGGLDLHIVTPRQFLDLLAGR